MVDTVVIENANAKAEPSLEEQAKAAGIDVDAIDSTATEQAAPVAPEVPEWVPDKFRKHENPLKAMAEAYGNLERKLGQGAKDDTEVESNEPQDEDEDEDEKPGTDNEKSATEQAEEAATKSGFDLQELSDSYWTNGSLTDEQYTALEQGGYPRGLVDQFIAGQRAAVELETAKVHLEVGGAESYVGMIEWAKTNLSEREIAAYDRAVNSDNMETVLAAVRGLKARADNEAGFEPRRTVKGTSGTPNTGGRYESIQEMQKDMNDPRYWKDAAFQAKVAQKLSRSSIL